MVGWQVANMARQAMRVPAMFTLVLAQLAMLGSQAGIGIGFLGTTGIPAMISGLPMLAPILLGGGLLLNSISNNAVSYDT